MRNHRRSIPLLIAALFVVLLAAACGSSSRPPTTVSSSAEHDQARISAQLVTFSRCMRSHGVPSFPDPDTPGFKGQLAPSTPHTPAFGPALSACSHLLPTSADRAARTPTEVAAFVAFAGCIRGHGFPTFPDPTSTGQLTYQMITSAGINLHQPAVVRVADSCVGVTQGVVTRAAVARFIAEH